MPNTFASWYMYSARIAGAETFGSNDVAVVLNIVTGFTPMPTDRTSHMIEDSSSRGLPEIVPPAPSGPFAPSGTSPIPLPNRMASAMTTFPAVPWLLMTTDPSALMPRIEMIGTEVNPAAADFAMIDADPRLPASMIDFVKLRRAIGSRSHPGIDRIKAIGRNVRRVRRGRRFGSAIRAGESIVDGIRRGAVVRVVPTRRASWYMVIPGTRKGDRSDRRVWSIEQRVVDHNLIRLMPDRPHRHNGCPGSEQIVGKQRRLILVAEVFDHAVVQPPAGTPCTRVVLIAMAGRYEHDLAGQRTGWLRSDRHKPCRGKSQSAFERLKRKQPMIRIRPLWFDVARP